MPVPKINANELADIMRLAFRKRIQLLILGAPGIGKTAITEQVTAELEMDLITLYPALSDPTDLKGYLTLDETGEPHYRAAGELARAMKATRPTILFLDELAQASESVQRACMSLVWARRVGEELLPDCVTFCAASNRNTDRAGAGAINTALLSRFHCVVELTPDVKSWERWALSAGLDMVLIHYVTNHPDVLNTPMPTGAANLYDRWPCARTLALCNDILTAGFPDAMLLRLLEGTVGESTAVGLNTLHKTMKALPKLAEVECEPHTSHIPKDLADRQYALAAFASRTTEQNIDRVSIYISRYPEEEQPRYWSILGKLKPALRGTDEFTAYTNASANA